MSRWNSASSAGVSPAPISAWYGSWTGTAVAPGAPSSLAARAHPPPGVSSTGPGHPRRGGVADGRRLLGGQGPYADPRAAELRGIEPGDSGAEARGDLAGGG